MAANSQATEPERQSPTVLLIFALVFPTLTTWVYFSLLAGHPAAWQQGAYLIGKVVQFGLPIYWVVVVQRARLRFTWSRLGLGLGAAVGGCVLLAMVMTFHGWLKPTGFFRSAQPLIEEKVRGLGITNAARFAVVGLFYSLIHSGLEEYYWRWFVYRQLRGKLPVAPAVIVSSLGFMAHHVLVLSTFFGWSAPATYLFSASVAMGGAIWALVYERSRSLLGTWVSHALVDAGIFWIGYDLVREMLI